MLAEMSSVQLVEWLAFFSLEPWGYDADNWRSGVVAATVANVNRKKDAEPYQPADFMPTKKKQQTPAEMIAALKSYG